MAEADFCKLLEIRDKLAIMSRLMAKMVEDLSRMIDLEEVTEKVE